MIPIREINEGDQFQNPFLGSGLVWVVVGKNEEERMIQLQAIKERVSSPVGKPTWKKNTDRMINENWRVFNIKEFLNGY